jgi:hypothetical protein
MKRLLCGSVVFAASFALASCSSDPTGDFRGEPARITADPSSIFLDQGTDADIIVRLEDDQGNPLAGDFEITAPGSGITVERNPDFQGTTVGVPLESEAQFIVTAGDAPISTSFTLAAGGKEVVIPVKVTPTSLTATFSSLTPAANEPVTISAAGYSFLPTAAVSFATDSAIILSNDGTSLVFLPTPGATGPALVEGIAIDFLPTTPLSLTTTDEIAVAAVTAAPGSDAPATAPVKTAPTAIGETTAFFDAGTFTGADITGDGGVGAQYYQFTIAEAGDYDFITDWPGGADLDPVVCFDVACAAGEFAGTGLDHPEHGTLTLAAGTYYFAAVLFAGDPPANFSVQITRLEPAPEE